MALETSSAFRGDGTGGVGIMTAVPDAREEMIRLLPMLEFGRQLGRGAFGSVYKAQLKSNGSMDTGLRAVKVVEPNKQPVSLRERFVRNVMDEIKLLNVASTKWSPCHPNIVRMYSDFRSPTSGNFFLVMEYCPGGDLKELISRYGLISMDVAKRFMLQLKNALQFMRKEGITHRDLKPANLLLTSRVLKDATLKVADFGLACELSPDSLRETMVGTPLYMAPEVLGKRQYGEKVDLWSAGVILYEMITGRAVYTVRSFNELQAAAAQGNPALTLPPSSKLKNAQCRDLLEKLLQSDPGKRMSFSDFYEHPFMQPAPPSMSVFNPGATVEVRQDSSSWDSNGGESKNADSGVMLSHDASEQRESFAVAASAASALSSSSSSSTQTSSPPALQNKMAAGEEFCSVGDSEDGRQGGGSILAFGPADEILVVDGSGGATGLNISTADIAAAVKAAPVSPAASSARLSCSDDWELLDAKDCFGSEEDDDDGDSAVEVAAIENLIPADVVKESILGIETKEAEEEDGKKGARGDDSNLPQRGPVAAAVDKDATSRSGEMPAIDQSVSKSFVVEQGSDAHQIYSSSTAASIDSEASSATASAREMSPINKVPHGDEYASNLSGSAPAADTLSSEKSAEAKTAQNGSPPPAPVTLAAAINAPAKSAIAGTSCATEENQHGAAFPKPYDIEPQISYNSISNVGDIVLFFQVRSSHGGNADSSTYMAFHDGRSKNHFLDLNCVEALRQQLCEGISLPKYFIGVVILSEKIAASATQNPFNLAEGTEFTVITAKPIESVFPQSFGLGRRSNSVEGASESVKITFRTFLPGDTVLCLPTRETSSLDDGALSDDRAAKMNGSGSISEIGSLAISRPDVTYIAFSDNKDASVYTASPESVAAFKRKNRVNHLTFMLGKVVMVSKLDQEEDKEETEKTTSDASAADLATMQQRIEARRTGSTKSRNRKKKKKSGARQRKERFLLTLAPL